MKATYLKCNIKENVDMKFRIIIVETNYDGYGIDLSKNEIQKIVHKLELFNVYAY